MLSCLILVPHHFRSIIFVDRKLARLNKARYFYISFWVLSNVLSFLELIDFLDKICWDQVFKGFWLSEKIIHRKLFFFFFCSSSRKD